MREKRLEQHLGQLLARHGALYYKFVSPGRPGVPDRIAVLPGGRIVFIELKTDTGRLSRVQEVEQRRIMDRGAEVYVVRPSTLSVFTAHLFHEPAHSPGGDAG